MPLPVVLLSGPLVVSWSRSLVVFSRQLPPVRAPRHPIVRLTSIVQAGARGATPCGRRLQTLRACRSSAASATRGGLRTVDGCRGLHPPSDAKAPSGGLRAGSLHLSRHLPPPPPRSWPRGQGVGLSPSIRRGRAGGFGLRAVGAALARDTSDTSPCARLHCPLPAPSRQPIPLSPPARGTLSATLSPVPLAFRAGRFRSNRLPAPLSRSRHIFCRLARGATRSHAGAPPPPHPRVLARCVFRFGVPPPSSGFALWNEGRAPVAWSYRHPAYPYCGGYVRVDVGRGGPSGREVRCRAPDHRSFGIVF